MSSTNPTGTPGDLSLTEYFGYDPTVYLRLFNVSSLAFLLFGMAFYEMIECATILSNARSKAHSFIFRALACALIFLSPGVVALVVAFSFNPDPTGDFYAGPFEYYYVLTGFVVQAAGKCSLIAATTKMVLAVYPGVKPIKGLVFTMAFVAVSAIIWAVVRLFILLGLMYNQHSVYSQTGSIDAMNADVEILGDAAMKYQYALVAELVSVHVFLLVTKIPFLMIIFKALNVTMAQAVRTMFKIKSTRRIFFSSVLCAIEVPLVRIFDTANIALAGYMYVLTYQITTAAMLAFEGSAAIIRTHSAAVLGNVTSSKRGFSVSFGTSTSRSPQG